jgi:hypothetical protein
MNLLKNCWQRRWIRGLVWTSVSIGTGYGLLCAGVNWSGARQLNATLAMIKAEGETLDFRAIVPEPVPDAENFCAIPLLKDLALVVDNDGYEGAPREKRKRLEALMDSERSRSASSRARPKGPSPILGKPTDLTAWTDWLREEPSGAAAAESGDAAGEVLAMLGKHDSIVRELADGMDRPKGQWTPAWKTRELPKLFANIAVPQFASIQGLTTLLSLRAVAAARAGDAGSAHQAGLILGRINEATWNEPLLIGSLVAANGTSLLCGVTWELCDAHAGTAGDFAKLETALVAADIRRSGLQVVRTEIAANFNTAQHILLNAEARTNLFPIFMGLSGNEHKTLAGLIQWLAPAIPAGFSDANASVLVDLKIRHVLRPLRDQDWLAVMQGSTEWEKETAVAKVNLWRHPTFLFASFMEVPMSNFFRKLVHTEALTAQAVIACALERHRIEKGEYPETLDPLKRADGSPLPPDIMTSQPMRYRREANGRYTLWSVGFDGKDDNGKRNLDPANPEAARFYKADYVGDWVWDFPAK